MGLKREELYDFFDKLDRSLFVGNDGRAYAHFDSPLPIGFGQTISQPSLVLRMTELLDLDASHKVLEIGTGSGYQTALLAAFSNEVYTVERIAELAEKAKERLIRLGYRNIHFNIGDGSEGLAEQAPYDRIMVTAAAPKLPEPLLEQLVPGGKMVLPVGRVNSQELVLVTKQTDGKLKKETMGTVAFVGLFGKYGWDTGEKGRGPEEGINEKAVR